MTFLNLVFLWGLPLLSIPIAIHLLSRRRKEVVKWGAMQFLTTSSIRRRKIWRIDDLLLMLLRALAVAALVMALARPFWHGWGSASGSGRDIVFVWDVSMSMGRTIQGETLFDHLLSRTEKILTHASGSDTIRGMVTIGRGEWLSADPATGTDENKRLLLETLKNVGITESSADWHACLNSAVRLALPSAANARLIVVLSDGQAEGWREKDQPAWNNLIHAAGDARIPTAIEIYNVNDSAVPANNVTVDQLTAPRHLLGIGEPYVVEAEVRNYGNTAVPEAILSWSLDQTELGTSSLGSLTAGQSTKVRFRHAAGNPGTSRLTCRLDLADDLPADNSRSLLLTTIDHVPLLVVDDAVDNDPLTTDRGYLLSALGLERTGEKNPNRAGVFQVRLITSTELDTEILSKFRAIVFPNTPTLNDVVIEKLTGFVRNGGGLWLAPGDRTTPLDFNRQFFRSGSGIVPLAIESAAGDLMGRNDFRTIHPPMKEHPATSLLSDTQRLDIDRAKIFQHFPFASAGSGGIAPVLLQSGTGEALVIEGTLGRGRIIVQSFPMGVRWTSLPLTQAYVPMVHEWLWYLLQPTSVSLNLMPGESLRVALPHNEHIRAVQLHSPGGKSVPLRTFLQGDQLLAQSRRTQLPGQYDVAIQFDGKPEETRTYQVQRAQAESNLNPWSAQLLDLWGNSPGIRMNPTAPLAMPPDTGIHTVGSPLWKWLLFLVMAAFIAELWIVGWVTGKRSGFQTDPNHIGTSTGQVIRPAFGIREST